MKKLLLLFALLVSFATSFAQAPSQFPYGTSGDPDTITNSATTNITARVPQTGGSSVAIQLNAKKVSGTVSGYAVLQASNDANFSPSMFSDISTDTLTFANSDNSKIWVVNTNYLHYRVKVVTSGTMVIAPKVYYLYKK